ncbi:MAG: AAA family ATPase, partial [Elusimicrobiota bacterium]
MKKNDFDANGLVDSEEIVEKMATKSFREELIALLKIHYNLIYMTCGEEKRMLNFFHHLSLSKGFDLYTWDCYSGIKNYGSGQKQVTTDDDCDEDAALDSIIKAARNDKKQTKVYILLDFNVYLESASVVRKLKTLTLFESRTSIIMAGPPCSVPDEMNNVVSFLDFPLPNRDEIEHTIRAICDSSKIKSEIPKLYEQTFSQMHHIVDAVSGLTLHEAQKALAKSVVVHRKFDIHTINDEKRNIISQKGVLEYFEPEVTMNDVGGLENLVAWLKSRQLALHPDAEKYGLPPLKGYMTVGVPGCGKSLIAKATASMYNIPLLRLDFGMIFNQYVGQSEGNAREATKLAEAIAPCVLWCDEVEKGISGVGDRSTNSGVTDRVFSTFLTWLQEKKSQVFVVCTANDHENIPPAFMRAGRFDETFFVDFPHREEIEQIYSVLLKRKNRNPNNFDIEKLSRRVDKITGAEIEKAIDMALFVGFEDAQREPTTEDIMYALDQF